MLSKPLVEEYARSVVMNHARNYKVVKDNWLSLLQRYENKSREGSITEDTESRIKLGGAFSLVENALPRILARQPKYKYIAREGGDSEAAETYEEFSDYQWSEAQAQTVVTEVAKWGLITGLAGWKMGWKTESILKKRKTKEILGVEIKAPWLEPLASDNIKEESETIHNYTLQAIRPFDLFWDSGATSRMNVKVLGHVETMTYADAKAMGFDVKKLSQEVKQSDYWKEKMDQSDKVYTDKEKAYLLNACPIRVAEAYVRLRNDEGYFENHIIHFGSVTEFGTPVTLSNEMNPLFKQFIPMGLFRPIMRPGKMYGFGLIEPVIGILEAEEDTLNMVVEAFWTDTSRPMEYNPNNILDVDSLEYRPRTLVPVRTLGQSVRVMETPTPSMAGFQFIGSYLKQSKQNASGITDFQTGAQEIGGEKTLGEVQIKTQESNARIALILDALEKEVLELIGRYALYFNQQYLPDKYMFRVLNRKGSPETKTIKNRDVQAITDIIITSGSTALSSQSEELQKYSLLLNQVYAEEQSPNPVKINKEIIWEDLFEKGLLIKDVERYVPALKDIEREEVQGENAQIDDAKSENENPLSARVLPTDIAEIHMPLHKAEIEARMQELQAAESHGVEIPPQATEELQMLIQHLNDHAAVAGGAVPQYAQGIGVGGPTEQGQPQQAQPMQ